ncbi:MAG: ion transporter [Thiomicrospira sp.]|uniref:ion transporter n=1 Tax=Thiomicrospira sp. TaxID=935 RepID=UPI0019E29898|nr:ion transporter [Thiomicrospira sp.]MBE0494765.1 ion transporter [Thiomicrospira sp.]
MLTSPSLRRRLATQLDPSLRDQEGLSGINLVVVILILASLFLAIIETEPTISDGHESLFWSIEVAFIMVFGVEYLARVWVSIENPENSSRWRYMLRPHALLDLFTLVIIILSTFGASAFLLRLARVLRVLRIARLGGYSTAINLMLGAVKKRRFELNISIVAAFVLLIISSSLLYLVEAHHQPESFGSIPRAMWWSIATLTTVGYGDVYPITVLGKVFAAFTALSGIGLIALPTGILAAAVSEAIQEGKNKTKSDKID